MIVKAVFTDVTLLTEIAIKSKSYWGYSKEFIESWRADLTVTNKMISICEVYKFEQNKETVGFYILNPSKQKTIELEMLFVLPSFIGKGIGKQLIIHAFKNAQKNKITSMNLLADPNAVSFYKSQGFVIVDKKESSISGRFLPIMQKDL